MTDTNNLLELFAGRLETRQYPAGTEIIKAGDLAEDGMYIILSGKVRVYGKKGDLINELKAGDLFGELALLNDEPRVATVMAVGEVVCSSISRKNFDEAAGRDKKIYGILLSTLYSRTTVMVHEREKMRMELEVAARIQKGILPVDFAPFREYPFLDIAASMKPAKNVGGDFYDVFAIDESRMCFLIADVSGKGIPAALFMVMAKTNIRNYMKMGLPLAEMAEQVNKRLCEENEEELFVTALICVLDCGTGELSFINAGHNLPYLSRLGGDFEKRYCTPDFVFGMMQEVKYREQHMKLEPGDRLFLYTDGVTEAMNQEDEEFGEQRLAQVLNQHLDDGSSGAAVMERLEEQIRMHAGETPQSDDITMIYVDRR